MRSELKDLHQRLGATMLYVTHDQGEAMSLSDRIAIMSGGRIEQFGAPRELYRNPANLFVARFLGEPGMTIMEGQVADGRFLAPDVSCDLPSECARWPSPIAMGIRPENLVPMAPGSAPLTGLVRTVEFLGSRSLIRVDVGPVLTMAFVSADANVRVGDRIGLSPGNPGDIHWFDVATGKVIRSNGALN